ncbi:MAG: hypothetical protein JWO03_777 [Bacteroidetes bacterium]|nr:hypothetical protein [Bacteroidota bacterium]
MKLKGLFFLLILIKSSFCFSQNEKAPWKLGVPDIKGKVKSLIEARDTSYVDSFSHSEAVYKWQYLFDEKGLCTSWSKLLHDTAIMTSTFTYSKSGKCILLKCDRIKTDSRKEMWQASYKYDSKDNLIKQSYINSDRSESILKYNDKGDLIEDNYYRPKAKKGKDGHHLHETPPHISKFVNRYENGLLIEANEMREDTVYSIKTYKYNSELKLVQLIKKGHAGRLWSQEGYSYDSTGWKYTSLVNDGKGSTRISYVMEYDKENNPTKNIWYNKDGTTRPITISYKFDSAGNWVEQISRIGEKIIGIKTRTIEYY